MNASSKSKSVKKAKKKEEWKPTGKVFTKIGYNWRPTGRTFTLVGNVCPLTRITATIKVPLREPIPLEVVQIVLWYLDSGCSNHMTKDRSQLTNFVYKFLGTVKLKFDSVSVKTVASDSVVSYKEALMESCWIEAMQEELNKFECLKVWELVPRPDRVMIITLNYTTRGHPYLYCIRCSYEHGRLPNGCEDPFWNVILREEVYFSQPDWFVYPENPNHVYKLKKSLYDLKQAPRAWYDLLSSFLLSQKFTKGSVDPTLFVRREGKDILLLQIYVDDIILASTKPDLCESFSKIMCSKFKMSMMGKLSFFLDIPMVEKSKLDEDPQGKAIDPTHYHGVIGTLMYLTSSRLDLVFAVCMCARYQAKPTEKNLHAMLTMRVAKIPKSIAISSTEAEYIALLGCSYRHQTSLYQRASGVRIEYQLADIFTKPLARERLDFLINKLGMRSMSLETLQKLADEEEE
ncbi:retrovirus-related pol polyprotein from transposon TNT 1-94 [Tanacetum coccineum]